MSEHISSLKNSVWNQLESSDGFTSETKDGNEFRLWIEGDSLKIEIHQPSGIRIKSVSRTRFIEWCQLWFENGERSASAYKNDTGRSLAANFSYVSHYFRWVESTKE